MKTWLLIGAIALFATACETSIDTSGLPTMDVAFTFEQPHKCEGVSPEIRLGNVPSAAATLDIKMTDLDAPRFKHWQQTIPVTTTIAEGRGTDYFGPCPPSGTHRYTISVLAKDAQEQPLAYGEHTEVTGR